MNIFWQYVDTTVCSHTDCLEHLHTNFSHALTIVGPPSQRYSATVGSSFKWDPEAKSYLAWLPLSDGSTLNKQRLQDLETLRWLDKNTRELEVKFIFYNGNFGRFTFAKITFTFDKGGIYRPYDPESGAVTQALLEGISVKVGSLNMEPYLKPIDFVRLALEVVFMVWVFSLTISIVREQLENFAAGKFMERVSAFTVFEFINLLCNIAFIVVRVLILQKITHGYVEVPVNDYKPIFEEVYQLTQSQLSINFISILLCIFRFFKYYQFQPRLQVGSPCPTRPPEQRESAQELVKAPIICGD